jgi:hypothetical protein
MDQSEVQNIVQKLMGEYGWMALAAMAVFLLKDVTANLVSGLMFLWGSDFDEDDVVYIGGTKRARIVRQTMTKTVFYLYDTDRKLIIPNKNLYSLKCEKALPKNGDD